MAVKVRIDEDTCIGCGVCEQMVPQVFKINMETMKAEVIAQPTEDLEDAVRSAAEACPTGSIIIEEE